MVGPQRGTRDPAQPRRSRPKSRTTPGAGSASSRRSTTHRARADRTADWSAKRVWPRRPPRRDAPDRQPDRADRTLPSAPRARCPRQRPISGVDRGSGHGRGGPMSCPSSRWTISTSPAPDSPRAAARLSTAGRGAESSLEPPRRHRSARNVFTSAGKAAAAAPGVAARGTDNRRTPIKITERDDHEIVTLKSWFRRECT
jgi:hypothetical protein